MIYELMKLEGKTVRKLAEAKDRKELFKIAIDRDLCTIERYGCVLKQGFEIMEAVVSKRAA